MGNKNKTKILDKTIDNSSLQNDNQKYNNTIEKLVIIHPNKKPTI